MLIYFTCRSPAFVWCRIFYPHRPQIRTPESKAGTKNPAWLVKITPCLELLCVSLFHCFFNYGKGKRKRFTSYIAFMGGILINFHFKNLGKISSPDVGPSQRHDEWTYSWIILSVGLIHRFPLIQWLFKTWSKSNSSQALWWWDWESGPVNAVIIDHMIWSDPSI